MSYILVYCLSKKSVKELLFSQIHLSSFPTWVQTPVQIEFQEGLPALPHPKENPDNVFENLPIY